MLSAIVFISGQKRYIRVPPQGSAIIDACKVLNIVRQEKHFNDALPSALEASGRLEKYPFASSPQYTDQYVLDVRRGFRSCRVSLLTEFVSWRMLTKFSRCLPSSLSTLFAGFRYGTTWSHKLEQWLCMEPQMISCKTLIQSHYASLFLFLTVIYTGSKFYF